MTQEHTPEPWSVSGIRKQTSIYGGEWLIARTDPAHSLNPEGQQVANARRIVACVNALAGISTEAIEGGVIAELLEAARQLRNAFDGQVQRMADRDLSESEHLLCKLFAQARDNLDRPLAKLEASK